MRAASMTMRDQFALAILPLIFNQKSRGETREERFIERARLAYEMADAMMKAREETPTKRN